MSNTLFRVCFVVLCSHIGTQLTSQRYLMEKNYAPIEDSDQTGQIRVLTVRSMGSK